MMRILASLVLVAALLQGRLAQEEPSPFPAGFSLPSDVQAVNGWGLESVHETCPSIWNAEGSNCNGEILQKYNQYVLDKIQTTFNDTKALLNKIALQQEEGKDNGRLLKLVRTVSMSNF